jgi:hypothetical protein
MFVAQSMVLVINCEARNTERKNRTENNILEYMKKSTMRRVNEDDPMQRDIAELNRLKQNKNRKYCWPGQLAVYSQPVEVTLYLTLLLKLNSYKHQH